MVHLFGYHLCRLGWLGRNNLKPSVTGGLMVGGGMPQLCFHIIFIILCLQYKFDRFLAFKNVNSYPKVNDEKPCSFCGGHFLWFYANLSFTWECQPVQSSLMVLKNGDGGYGQGPYISHLKLYTQFDWVVVEVLHWRSSGWCSSPH